MDTLAAGSALPDQKRQKTKAAFIVAVLGQAVRIVPKLREALGPDWEVVPVKVEEAQKGKIDEAIALVTPPTPAVNALLKRLPRLRLLQTMSAGVDSLDLEACPSSVTVCNTSSMDHAIAEYVLASILHWKLQLVEEDRKFKQEKYFVPPYRFVGCKMGPAPFHDELGSKVLGIVGYGNIGTQIAKRAAAFNMRVVGVTRRLRASPPEGLAWCGTVADLPRLMNESNFVVVCCALTDDTRGLINGDLLAKMRDDAVIINVARGPVIEEDALYHALLHKRIRGAVLDVWWNYPTQEEPEVLPSKHPFHSLDNVLMTPHSSGWTSEQEERKVEQVSHNIKQLGLLQPSFRFVCKPSECPA